MTSIEEKEILNSLEKTLIDEKIGVHKGLANNVLPEVLSSLHNAISVKNTFVIYGISDTQQLLQIYPIEQIKLVKKTTTDFISSKKTHKVWQDLLSQEVLNNQHFDYKNFSEALCKNHNQNYSARYLKDSYPIVNFMILEYPNNRKKDLYFGWGHHTSDPNGAVYYTNNEDIVRTFSRYWNTLCDNNVSSPV